MTNAKEIKMTGAELNQIDPDENRRWDFKGCQGQKERMSSVIGHEVRGTPRVAYWPASMSNGKSVGCSQPLSTTAFPRE